MCNDPIVAPGARGGCLPQARRAAGAAAGRLPRAASGVASAARKAGRALVESLAAAPGGAPEVLRLVRLRKTYNPGTPLATEVLHGIDLRLQEGELAALIGPSGSGKSTLLNLIGLLDTPSGGELYLQGQPTAGMDDDERTRLRNHCIGFVFQFHHLINAFSAEENVLMPLMIRGGRPSAEARARARQLLAQVGLEKFARQKPAQLSGGQQQRVAIARALVARPALLLADEPTGNLDTRAAASVFELFGDINREFGCAVLVVTHDPRLAARCRRVIELVDGGVVRDEAQAPALPLASG